MSRRFHRFLTYLKAFNVSLSVLIPHKLYYPLLILTLMISKHLKYHLHIIIFFLSKSVGV